MKITRPMLAATVTPDNIDKLRYPLLATPKIDGIRCLVLDGKAVSRTFKPIPNVYIRTALETLRDLDWVDGELTCGKTFQSCSSGIMSFYMQPDFTYHIFDCDIHSELLTYKQRADKLLWYSDIPYVDIIYPQTIHNRQQLDVYESKCIQDGYEGIMLRAPDSPYKCGRSTFKEHYLLKLKRFHDSEAIVIGYEELMHNENYSSTDNFGLAERSSSKDGLVPAGTLGALVVKDITSGIEFKIGTGFTEKQRAEIWKNREVYLGKVLTYKSQLHGVKDKPRCPVFKGWRLDL